MHRSDVLWADATDDTDGQSEQPTALIREAVNSMGEFITKVIEVRNGMGVVLVAVIGVVVVLGCLLVPAFRWALMGYFVEKGRLAASRNIHFPWSKQRRKSSKGPGKRQWLRLRKPRQPELESNREGIIALGYRPETALQAIRENAGATVRETWCISESTLASTGYESLQEQMRRAELAYDNGTISKLVVAISLPLSGSWKAESEPEIRRVLSRVCEHESMPVRIMFEEPLDISEWPELVCIEGNALPGELRRMRGTPDLPDHLARLAETAKSPLKLPREEAAQLLHRLASDTKASSFPACPPLPDNFRMPPYEEFLDVAIKSRPHDDHVGHLSHEGREAKQIRQYLREAHLTIRGISSDSSSRDGLQDPWDLPTRCRRVVANWPLERPQVSASLLDFDGMMVAALDTAVKARSLHHANYLVFQLGRAWIESPEAASRTEQLKNVRRTFEDTSRAGLWVHYLLALDSNLRENSPESEFFSEEICRAASDERLGRLFKVERLEHTRRSGNVDQCFDMLIRNWPELREPTGGNSLEDKYVDGTADYVLANILRSAGRYDRAKQLIERAQSTLLIGVPAMEVELAHCVYAATVCDAMLGEGPIPKLDALGARGYVFAEALICLASAQRSWQIEDYSRALEFLASGRKKFELIGYNRHLRRVEVVEELMRIWANLDGRTDIKIIKPIHQAGQLAWTAASGSEDLLGLSALRPSMALSIILFGLKFSRSADAHRTIKLPAMLAETGDDAFKIVKECYVSSLREADKELRKSMKIPMKAQPPLAPD